MPQGGTLPELLEDAPSFGFSPCQILSLFSDRRHFGYWLFDGDKVYVSGALAGFGDHANASDENSRVEQFRPRIDPDIRVRMHDAMRTAFAEKRGFSVTYPVTRTDGLQRMFTSAAEYRVHEDGSADLFGIFYERFLPARMVSLLEKEIAPSK